GDRLRDLRTRPSPRRSAFGPPNARRKAPPPASSMWSGAVWNSPRASYSVTRPRARTRMPWRGWNFSQLLLGLNIAARTCARSSFNVTYRCPDDGRATLPSSASIHTEGKVPSSVSRARVLSWLGVRAVGGASGIIGDRGDPARHDTRTRDPSSSGSGHCGGRHGGGGTIAAHGIRRRHRMHSPPVRAGSPPTDPPGPGRWRRGGWRCAGGGAVHDQHR